MNKIATIEFGGEPIDIFKTTYSDGNTALVAKDMDGMPYMTITANIPEAPKEDNEVFIKDYSENKGIMKALVEAGVVTDNNWSVYSNFSELKLATINE